MKKSKTQGGELLTGLTEEDGVLLARYMEERGKLVDGLLEKLIPAPRLRLSPILEAMRYTLFAGGKRLRPIISLASAEAVGGAPEDALPAACAIELIHTYSLIHDDLPSVDDDDFRRGKPSSHKVFGEAMAIFAGDALLTHAFLTLADTRLFPGKDPALLLQVVADIARAAGIEGMVGGQVVDILSEGEEIEPSTLDYIHSNKTAALIRVSARAGAILGGGEKEHVQSITDYGGKVGLAFQIVDDLLDATEGGAQSGSDQRLGKATYPAVHGMEKSRRKTGQLVEEALAHISRLGVSADPLRRIAWFISLRGH